MHSWAYGSLYDIHVYNGREDNNMRQSSPLHEILQEDSYADHDFHEGHAQRTMTGIEHAGCLHCFIDSHMSFWDQGDLLDTT